MKKNTYYDMDLDVLKSHIVGHTIVDIDTNSNTLVLDNGVILELVDAYECCAYFKALLDNINLKGNIVTALEYIDYDSSSPVSWGISILNESSIIGNILIEGNPTSGYYFHSINLEVSHINTLER